MPALEPGDTAPDFTLPSSGGSTIALSSLRGQKVVLYFYPKDDTPGCTREACSFSENLSALNAIQAKVIGVSRDNPASHDAFISKYGLKFPLASDEDGKVCEAYGVWGEKSMYGKKYMGIDRATFLIGEDGKILRVWRSVKVDGHTEDVLSALKAA